MELVAKSISWLETKSRLEPLEFLKCHLNKSDKKKLDLVYRLLWDGSHSFPATNCPVFLHNFVRYLASCASDLMLTGDQKRLSQPTQLIPDGVWSIICSSNCIAGLLVTWSSDWWLSRLPNVLWGVAEQCFNLHKYTHPEITSRL